MGKRLLIHPPFADPTQPYLSLPSLKAYLMERGLDVQVLDLNVEAAHWLFHQETVEDVARNLGLRFLKLNRADALDFEEQREYRMLVECRSKIEEVLGADVSPIEVFQSRERFYDPAQYSIARRRVEYFFEALSAVYFPYRFNFNHAGHSLLPWSFDLLESYASEQKSPLHEFYRQVFEAPKDWESLESGMPYVPLEEFDFVGVSVVFPSQIGEAFALCRALKERAPRAFVALGGPCIHQIVLHMQESWQRRVFSFVDGVGLYEGEETLAQLFPRLANWQAESDQARRLDLLKSVPNLLLWDRASDTKHEGPLHVMSLDEVPAPDYSDLSLDRYLAPSRTLLYAPTRGCYWNQCSFCYYGLSETATATYREIAPDRAALDLAKLAQRHGVKNFYLSCDVLSPAYAMRFAEALQKRGVKIRWSSDLKIEAYFTAERCQLLYQAGLRAAAFGIESGSDRILALMRKGTDRATMTRVNRDFHAAGVATEWMTFTDHPNESVEEALETVRWIQQEQEFVDLFIVGEFGLERGSHIFQDPGRYGIEKIYYAEGDELRIYALFTQKRGRRSAADREAVDREIAAIASHYAQKSYPWAGANSTHHTLLHFLAFGQRAFRTHFQKAHAAFHGALPPPPTSHLPGLKEYTRFSLAAIVERERKFLEEYLPKALYTTFPGRRSGTDTESAALSWEHYREACEAIPPLRPGQHRQ